MGRGRPTTTYTAKVRNRTQHKFTLFYHPNDTSLYAVILEPSKNESSLCRIYKLAFPPLIPTKTSNIEINQINGGI